MGIVQCPRSGPESGRRRTDSGDVAPFFGSARSSDSGDKCSNRGTTTIKGTPGVKKPTNHMSDPVKSYRGGRKLALCTRSYWALLCLQIHVLKAVATTDVKLSSWRAICRIPVLDNGSMEFLQEHPYKANIVHPEGDVAPYFKTEPGPPEIHLEGNRLVMTCLAEGSWPLEFKWSLNNTDITAFSPEYKYIISSLQRSDMGVYQCVVRNRMGALLQRRAEIQVAYMGDFVEDDQRKTVTQGRAAILNSPDVSSFPRPQVPVCFLLIQKMWLVYPEPKSIINQNLRRDRSGFLVETGAQYDCVDILITISYISEQAITMENQLVVLSTAAADTGRYYVQAVNERNGENKTSPSIYLNVAGATKISDMPENHLTIR
ncbi:Protein sidekick-1 [Bagarius yarrelli]|uniref:Protein sidekick-1 n=1 Tax=Bagarius yarrelli TaxID=175774 RepID=A0A556TP72_BAGYA|nr:Protein sidekick-1 [Bagarius yarrelli]